MSMLGVAHRVGPPLVRERLVTAVPGRVCVAAATGTRLLMRRARTTGATRCSGLSQQSVLTDGTRDLFACTPSGYGQLRSTARRAELGRDGMSASRLLREYDNPFVTPTGRKPSVATGRIAKRHQRIG